MAIKKSRSVIEVLLIVAFFRLVRWGWNITSLAKTERDIFHSDYFIHLLFVLVPIIILMLAKRNPNFYGLILRKNFRASLKWGLVFGGILVVPIFIEVLLGWQNIEIPKFWLSTIIFQVIFAGFCEEILYRGYYQSRINETFDRPWDISGLKFGIGLIAISVLFGFAHVLNTYNPLQGQYSFDWVGGLIALQTGLFYGFVREKTGSILASAVIHGSTFWWDFLADGSTRYIGMSIGWCISWIVLFAIFSRTKSTEYDDLGSQSHVPIT